MVKLPPRFFTNKVLKILTFNFQNNILVKTSIGTCIFPTKRDTKCANLFEEVCKTLYLKEIWYFGLYCNDKQGQQKWLKLSKVIRKIEFGEDKSINLRAILYPKEDSIMTSSCLVNFCTLNFCI